MARKKKQKQMFIYDIELGKIPILPADATPEEIAENERLIQRRINAVSPHKQIKLFGKKVAKLEKEAEEIDKDKNKDKQNEQIHKRA